MQAHGSVRVAADTVGILSYRLCLVDAIWQTLENGLHGMHHWTDTGVASRYDFAVAVTEETPVFGFLKRVAVVTLIGTTGSAATALRPIYSALGKETAWEALQLRHPNWRVHLCLLFKEFSANGEYTGGA